MFTDGGPLERMVVKAFKIMGIIYGIVFLGFVLFYTVCFILLIFNPSS